MSKTRMILAQIAALTMMAVACWVVTGAVPLRAQAQMVADGPGVTVNLNGSQLMHRSPVSYPIEALAKGVEGTVVVQVRLDANGEVIDDAVLSGPDELRKGVQQSVLNWHFDKSAGSATRVVNIDFMKPANSVPGMSPPAAVRAQIMATAPGGRGAPPQGTLAQLSAEQQYEILRGQIATAEQRLAQTNDSSQAAALQQLRTRLEEFKAANAGRLPQQFGPSGTIERIDVLGLSESARAQLLAQLPVHVGDAHSPENMDRIREAARLFDQHLVVTGSSAGGSGAWAVRIGTPDAPLAGMNTPLPAGTITVGGNAQAANLITKVTPVYPPLAKMARQQGTVKFETTIGPDGTVQDLKVLSGPPLLIPAALEAAKKWVYQPTLLNGVPVPVSTTIEINFSLSDGPPPTQ